MMAAALAEPLSVADHCGMDCAKTTKGELVVVSGPGIIGTLLRPSRTVQRRGGDHGGYRS